MFQDYDLYFGEEKLTNINNNCLQIENKENDTKMFDGNFLSFDDSYQNKVKLNDNRSLISDFELFGLDMLAFNRSESETTLKVKPQTSFLLSQLAAEELEANKRLKQDKHEQNELSLMIP